MEMVQGFHSVDMYGAGVGEAEQELTSSSSLSSPALSSPQNSPHSSHSSIPSPSIENPSPAVNQPLVAQRSSERVVYSVQMVPFQCEPGQPIHTRVQALNSLDESIPHGYRLGQRLKEEKTHQKDAIWHKRSVRRLSKEIYLIVSLYALLQGALFTAVAQSTIFTCTDWWGPVGIVGAVTVGTIIGTWDKLYRMGQEKQEAKKFELRQSAVNDKIMELYWRGSAYSIEGTEPGHMEQFDNEPGMACIASVRGLVVLGFLAGFSGLIIISCMLMLCHPCRCQ